MSLTSDQQFHELFKKSSSPLLLISPYASDDDLAAASALALIAEAAGKEVALAGDNALSLSRRLPFATPPRHLLSSIAGARDFVLSFFTRHNRILGIRSAQEGDEYRIYLTPEKGAIDPRDFSFLPSKFKYDLAILVGVSDTEKLGRIYEENPDIFYELPMINIDHHSENELYGQVNIVDLTASSKCEIVAELLTTHVPDFITPEVAELLLSGIISATESFQRKNTTPRSLRVAADLIKRGADQQKIVRALYRNQPLPLLKLWGRAMSNVQLEESLRLIYATITLEDLVQSRADASDLPEVLNKIRSSFSAASLFALLFRDTTDSSRVLLKANNRDILSSLKDHLQGSILHGDTLEIPVPGGDALVATTNFLGLLRGALPQSLHSFDEETRGLPR